MKKEKPVRDACEFRTARITRARAATLHANVSASSASNENNIVSDKKQIAGDNSMTAALDEKPFLTSCNGVFQQKKRANAMLKDISNICNKKSQNNCIIPTRKQAKISEWPKPGPHGKLHSDLKASKVAPNFSGQRAVVQDIAKKKMDDGIGQKKSLETTFLLNPQVVERCRDGEGACVTALLEEHNLREEPIDSLKNVKSYFSNEHGCLTVVNYIDIDSDHANPQMCSLYASEIYTKLYAAELIQRPSSDFMETLQRDITWSMRGILIDWLVEVSEEYMLVPDTLFLTVNIIDRFLSKKIIERQRLQLLGITSILIASKYEEICAPRVEELCFITDNTYKKEEVLKMESQVLNYLGFKLSIPTIKTFLRRFLQAEQASCEDPKLSLGYLSSYLVELTLTEYSFLKFLPSIIAASSVFLARWTLDPSRHPWDKTMQHYSSYKASDLKEAVLALQNLQMNSKNCPLNAIREKYRQQKFKFVAELTSTELLPSVFG